MTFLDLFWIILIVAGAAALTYRGFRNGKCICSGCPLSFCSKKNACPDEVVEEPVLEYRDDLAPDKMI